MFMRGVVVGDEMNLFIRRCLSVDEVEESNPFFMRVSRLARPDDLPIKNGQAGEERRRSVPFVIVVMVPARPRFIGRPGCVRSSA